MNCARCRREYPGGDPTKPGADLCALCLLDEDVPAAELKDALERARGFELPPMISRSILRQSSRMGGQVRRRGQRKPR